MTEPPTPPAWVRKRDGSRVPFDADKISQALFAATETLGRPDAFLARELTDGVLHFVAVEKDEDTLTTAQIAEIVGKTVRELGQPALAEAFASFAAAPRIAKDIDNAIVLHAQRDVSPQHLFPNLVREYTRQAIYSRQVLAAQSDGLLVLTGLETPGELEACTIGLFESAVDALADLRLYTGGCAAFDGPEYALFHRTATPADLDRFVSESSLASRFLGLRTVVNLNSAEPPPWAGELARGPLFAGQLPAPDDTALAAVDKGFGNNPDAHNELIVGSAEQRAKRPSNKEFRRNYHAMPYPLLANVISGNIRGRENDTEAIFYSNNSSGLQFAAVGRLVYERAKAAKLGVPLPIEWFLQDIRN